MDCLDTSVWIHAIKAWGTPEGQGNEMEERVRVLLAPPEPLPDFSILMPTVVMTELLAKATAADRQALTSYMAKHCMLLPFDAAAASIAGVLTRRGLTEAKRQGISRRCAKADILIAATAISAGAKRIITCNPKHFVAFEDRITILEPPTYAIAAKLNYN